MVNMIDAPLACGETPLMLACRHHRPDMVLLLLRHRASVDSSWLFFRSALEVLLFSPNIVVVDEPGLEDIKTCITLYQRATTSINIERLKDMEKDGRCALYPGWYQLISHDQYKHPALLTHLCRHSIRRHLYMRSDVPTMIATLPLPQVLQKYVDLLCDWSWYCRNSFRNICKIIIKLCRLHFVLILFLYIETHLMQADWCRYRLMQTYKYIIHS